MNNDDEMMAAVQQIIPMQIRRYGQPEEVGQLLHFLGSPENSFMVGQIIFIDGGGEASNHGDQIVASAPNTPTLAPTIVGQPKRGAPA